MIQIGSAERPFDSNVMWEDKLIEFNTQVEQLTNGVMKATILEGDSTLPIALLLSDKKLATVFPQNPDEGFDKEAFHGFIGTYGKRMEAKEIFYIGEIWYTKYEKKPDNFVLPSESPDKREALLRVYINVQEKNGTMIMEEILRGEIVTLSEPIETELTEKDLETSKMFQKMLNEVGQIVYETPSTLNKMFKSEGGEDATID